MDNYHRHEGDDLLPDDKRLKFKWKWSRVASGISNTQLKKWTHFQSSYCDISKWTLNAIQWGGTEVYYTTVIDYVGNRIESQRFHCTTRIDAQIAVEKYFLKWLEEQLKEVEKSKIS